MKNAITKEYNFFSLIKFAFPSIAMMVFMALYTMVDGVFVSKFVGTSALSAVNIVYPMYNIIIAVGIMLATGGSAIIGKQIGEAKHYEAKQTFSLIVLFGTIIGMIILVLGISFIKPMLAILGATPNIYQYCFDYALILLLFSPCIILQLLFQFFFISAGKPNLGLLVTIIGGCANIILDYIFIVPLKMGVSGAAIATGIGLSIPSFYGIYYFARHKLGSIHFVKIKWNAEVIIQSCFNGSSEMISNIAMAIVTFLFNLIMLKYLGEDGVAAITIMLYAQFLLNAVFMGYAMGVSPIISFNYGAQNIIQTKKIFKYCMIFISLISIVSYGLAVLFSPLIISIFSEVGSNVFKIAESGFSLFCLNFLFAGLNIFSSSLFTAFSNGKVSAIISFLRTFVFISAGIIILPLFLGVDGVWISVSIAEALASVVCFIYLYKYKNVYHYY